MNTPFNTPFNSDGEENSFHRTQALFGRRTPRILLPQTIQMSSRDEEEEIQRIRSGAPLFVLYLDGHKSHIRSIETLRAIGVNRLEELSMVNMRMTGLFSVPRMPKLKVLDLSNNRITGNLHRLQVCPNLIHLNLSRNKIKNIETLYPLKGMPFLYSLDLFGNSVMFIDNYRQRVFALIKNIRYLDGSVRETDEE